MWYWQTKIARALNKIASMCWIFLFVVWWIMQWSHNFLQLSEISLNFCEKSAAIDHIHIRRLFHSKLAIGRCSDGLGRTQHFDCIAFQNINNRKRTIFSHFIDFDSVLFILFHFFFTLTNNKFHFSSFHLPSCSHMNRIRVGNISYEWFICIGCIGCGTFTEKGQHSPSASRINHTRCDTIDARKVANRFQFGARS